MLASTVRCGFFCLGRDRSRYVPGLVTRISVPDVRLLRTLEQAFATHAGPDQKIDRGELQRALGIRSPELAARIFDQFDTDRSGAIDLAEFMAAVRTLIFGTEREKLGFALRLWDDDRDGALDRREVHRMIALALAESDVSARASQPPDHLANALFLALDKNRDGKLSFGELEAGFRQHPELLHKMTRSEAIWIAPNEALLRWIDGDEALAPPPARRWIENNVPLVVLLVLWGLAHVVVAGVALARSPDSDVARKLGRVFARCIDLDGALILVPMMRRLLTKVRATFLGRALPIDDAVAFHRIVGHTLFAFALAHTAAVSVAWLRGHATGHLGIFLHLRGATGLALLAVFGVMWAFALDVVRRKGRFELFYLTHLLYVAWLGLAIAHGPHFLWFAGLPLAGFAVEQLLRVRRRGVAAAVTSSQALRSGVVRLEIEKPTPFRAGPDDYAFLRIPSIARGEWHPFTISSAPERGSLVFHVRALGNWTKALRERVTAEPDAMDMIAYVDGPYGSPSAHIFQSRYAVLIGGGIGVTPFASVLESIVLRAYGSSDRPSNLKKVHFFWLNRDAFSFEWFADLLAELEKEDTRALLDLHLCMTGARAGAEALGLELARELMHAAGRSDFMSGLRAKTHFGVPNWDEMLGAIARRHAGETVDVYFCGPPGLGAKLRPLCQKLGMTFREERF
jgi:predicted ferric reductase/Ca2+-binding EF-hand superfamily protein